MADRNDRHGDRGEGRGRGERRDESRDRNTSTDNRKVVYALTERGEKTWWTRVGIGFVNADGSITCRLEALPVSGQLQIRDPEPRDEAQER